MSPFAFSILCHYYVSPEPYREGNPVAVDACVESFISTGMLEAADPETTARHGAKYRATERAVFWINAALSTPFPVSVWAIPSPKEGE